MKSVAAFLVVALIWFSGLLAFADRVQGSTPNRAPAQAQGIVALTGGNSSERLSAAMGLLEDGYGRRVLVSGVDPIASRADIRRVSRAVRRLYDCCVDLGFTAADTVGNARETASWSAAMRYERLIIVTADYHMPRAMLELKEALDNRQLNDVPGLENPTTEKLAQWLWGRMAERFAGLYCVTVQEHPARGVRYFGPAA